MAETCPYCGNEMVKGYIQCRDGVYWSEKFRAIAAIPPFDKSATVLKSGSSGLFKGDAVEAYNCKKKKKIIISYDE